jgi:predicted PurR-regulated permease PerM
MIAAMLEDLPRTRRNLFLGAVALLVLLFAWQIRSVLNPLLLGYLLAFILQPAVTRLQSRGLRRSMAVVTVFAVAFCGTGLLGLGLFYQGRALLRDVLPAAVTSEAPDREADAAAAEGEAVGTAEGEAEAAADPQGDGAGPEESAADQAEGSAAAPRRYVDVGGAERAEEDEEPDVGRQGLERLRAWLALHLGEDLVPASLPTMDDLSGLFAGNEDAMAAGVAAASSVWSVLASFFGGVVGVSTLLVLVPIYGFFWLFELDRLNRYVREHLPRRYRARFTRIFSQLGEVLSRFFRGRLLVCLVKGLFLTVALALAGVPYALLLGTLGGLLSIVPFLGGILAFTLALLVALSSHGLLYAVVATAVVFAAAELFEGYVLMPRILGESLGLSDVTVIFAITAGGASLGLLGVLLALPLAAVIKVLYIEFVQPALEQFADEQSELHLG